MIMTPLMHRSAYAVSPSAMDAALQRFLQATTTTTTQDSVQQDGQVFSIKVDVPGLSREQLHIELQDKTVRLSSIEGAPRSVQRAWKLPASIDAAASKASLENGVLTLVLTTSQPATQTLAIA
ncbi:Hsp20 family protein [Comamonas piscis]|uniref:Hsp20 family protein n=1 Tax=Comamonas piscis TaxID=1562974 RepID=A0A7G5EG76_9BURK|nr:Hsp20/alpha crystallin family protein [Comamonas piscis]QMV73001.1 Hsp20 family protein [Comamonas piscis]WSO35784.1 Hsp20/alpha crystallin family protein [Comamonas piscis]